MKNHRCWKHICGWGR